MLVSVPFTNCMYVARFSVIECSTMRLKALNNIVQKLHYGISNGR